MAGRLLAFIAPHGVLELSSIFICGGGGLLVGKALLFPGNRRRIDSLKLAMKDALALFAGCIPLLVLAGMLEGFVSPRTDLDANAKLAVGLATLLLLVLYLFIVRQKKDLEKIPGRVNFNLFAPLSGIK